MQPTKDSQRLARERQSLEEVSYIDSVACFYGYASISPQFFVENKRYIDVDKQVSE